MQGNCGCGGWVSGMLATAHGCRRMRGRGVVVRAVFLAIALALVATPAGAQAPGALDTSFEGDGIATTPIGASHDEAHAVALQPDGDIVVTGFSESGTGRRFAVVRYNVDGSLDATFDGDGRVTLPPIGTGSRDESYAVALQPDGKIVVAGEAWGTDGQPHFAVARLNPDGSLDGAFGDGGLLTTPIGAKSAARGVALGVDGTILVGGYSSTITGAGGWGTLVRYNPDGSLDPTFNDDDRVPTPPGVVVTDVGSSSVYFAVAIGPDGRIVATGRTQAGNFEMLVVRYHPSGALDGSFGPVGTTRGGIVITSVSIGTDSAQALQLLDDGRIVIAGFAQVSGFQFAVARYHETGALDAQFGGDGIVTTQIGSLSQGFGVRVDPDGRAVVAGEGVAGSDRNFALARYRTDGSLDSTFGTGGFLTTPIGSAIDSGRSVALEPDGRIVVAGITDSGGSAQGDFAVVRYHSDPPPPPVDRTLTVALGGTGGGTVMSQPTGIDCGSDCTETYTDGTVVELTAIPASGSTFAGWAGDCGGTGTCQATLDADRSVTATFDAIPPPVIVSTNPADGATAVGVDTAVSATFDAPLETFSLTLANERGKSVEGVLSCNSPCTTTTFTPTRSLAGRTTYTVTATGTGSGGTTTDTWTFTTGRKGGKPA